MSNERGRAVKRTKIEIRDRVVELRRVPARDVQTHPMNWRKHGKHQRAVMRGVFKEVGFVKPVDVYTPMPDDELVRAGKLRAGVPCLIDGHLRQDELPPDFMLSLNVTDLTEREALKYLATADPIAALAEQDDAMLTEVVDRIDSDDAAIQKMISDMLKADEGDDDSDDDEDDDAGGRETFAVMVKCDDADHQQSVLTQLLALGLDAKSVL